MDGPGMLLYVKRRLREYGSVVGVEGDRDGELYDYLTEGRDRLLQTFALAAPVVVQSTVALELVGERDLRLPAGTPDPFRILELREAGTGAPLTPASQLDVSEGEYKWINVRQLRLRRGLRLRGGVEADMVPHAGPIGAATTEVQIGLPTTLHRAVGKAAAVLALTADEETDAMVATNQLEDEIARLERIYGEFDGMGGLTLRDALLSSFSAWEEG